VTAVRVASWSNVLPAWSTLLPYRDGLMRARDRATPFIPRGAGRSFGDAAYVSRGDAVCSPLADRRHAVDLATDTLTCDAGVGIGELQRASERAGRYLAVFGGTQWATAGGAVASDIHSKDDPHTGSCGNHVEALTVITADGERVRCSRGERPELFAATVGGMGMTGYIERVTFKLAPARPLAVRIRGRRFRTIADMQALFAATRARFAVTEWVDLTRAQPEGIFWQASFVDDAEVAEPRTASEFRLPRIAAFNRATVRLIEYITLQAATRVDFTAHRRRFNYGSLHEVLRHYNQLFGARGFLEYHFAVPAVCFAEAFSRLVRDARRRAVPLFFGAGKLFGDLPRAGLMSFPGPGFGMNFQTPDHPAHRRFLVELGDVVADLGGRVYLAKDAVATPAQLRRMYPQLAAWQATLRQYDPDKRIASNLSRRLDLKPW
jgi:FAD/FMN-containing dehydrogenase